MAEETLAAYFTEGIKPYDDADRKADSTRLIRLVEAKRMLREAAEFIDVETPALWQLLIAEALDYSGNALLTFAGGLKSKVKFAGSFDWIGEKLWPEALPSLAPLAAKYADFWGVRTVVSSSLWQSVVKWFAPSPDNVAEGALMNGMRLTRANRIAKLVDQACVSGFAGVSRREFALKSGRVLPQRPRQRRVRKQVRSRNHGR